MLKKKRVAILVAQNFHDEETTIPRDFLENLGAIVDIVGLNKEELTGKYGRVTLLPDKNIEQIAAKDYDAILLPGGGAPEKIRMNQKAIQFVKEFWKTGRPIGAICHGPQILISAGVLKGVTTTGYMGIRDDIVNSGAIFIDKDVCIDGQLITSRTPDDLPEFNKVFSQALSGELLKNEDLSALDALQMAISREKGAQDFYLGVSERIKEEAVKNKFKYLAAIEEGHFLQLSDLYKNLTGGRDAKINIKNNELGKHKVSEDISAHEAIELAIKAEEAAYEFYRSAALKSKSHKVSEMFEFLAAEELEHKRLFLVDKASASGGQGYFQWATHFDIPPGMDDLW